MPVPMIEAVLTPKGPQYAVSPEAMIHHLTCTMLVTFLTSRQACSAKLNVLAGFVGECVRCPAHSLLWVK